MTVLIHAAHSSSLVAITLMFNIEISLIIAQLQIQHLSLLKCFMY